VLSFNGDRLQDTVEILCYEPGIEVLRLSLVTNKLVNAQVKIAPECALGEHHLRLRTATGLSELRTFLVGPFPVLAEKEPNNDPAHAQKIPLNTTVTGVITSEDVDCFAIETSQGQRISAEVEGMRLGRGVFDPRLAMLDSTGAILADVDDTWLSVQDPFVSLIAPKDGTYILQLREATYGGDDKCQYRLHLGSFPRPVTVYPLGGKAGEILNIKFFSEATGEFTQQVKLPDWPCEKFGVFAELDGLPAPTPNWIRVSVFPNVLEAPPNQDREHATAAELQPPLALNGIISQKGEEDWFRFQVVKGVALEASVYARRLRSPLDSVLEVFDAAGQQLASDDDAAGADSSLKFTPSATTNYFIRIRDTLGQGGRDFAYRVEITPVQPAISVKIPEVARNDTQSRQIITVPRGNRFATLVSAKRANFGGELVFGTTSGPAEPFVARATKGSTGIGAGLPSEDGQGVGLPAGVTMLAERMPANIDAMPLVFEAAADAPLGCKLLDLTATGTNASGNVVGKFRQDVELVPGPNNTSFYGTSVDKLCVAVTKEAPFKLRIVEPEVPLVQAGSMRLEVAVERAPDFDEPIKLEMVWNPPGVSSQSEATIPKGATNAFYTLNAGGNSETRSWKIAVLGHATGDGGEVYVSSQLARLEVATPFLAGKIETVSLKPGQSGKLTVHLQQSKPFDGKATIKLVGLPERVKTSEQEVTKDDQEVVFDLTVDPKCSPGSHKNLFCAVDVKQNGQVIPHTIASGGILRIVPPKKELAKVAAVEGKK